MILGHQVWKKMDIQLLLNATMPQCNAHGCAFQNKYTITPGSLWKNKNVLKINLKKNIASAR
jgi:hypothetical protein